MIAKNTVFRGQRLKSFSITASYPGPTIINVRTDNTIKNPEVSGITESPEEALNLVKLGVENGFRLTHTQTTNCFRNSP